jgi:glutathione S-transferase
LAADEEESMTRPIRILGRDTSINVRKVLWLCHEIDLPYELEPWGAPGHPTDTPAFRALNPNVPTAARERAVIEQWMDWQACELNISWRYAFMALARKSPAHTDPAAMAASVSSWSHHMTVLEQQLLATGAYAVGPRFTLADIGLGLSTHRWFATLPERPTLPAVLAYYERLSERSGFLAHGRNGVP